MLCDPNGTELEPGCGSGFKLPLSYYLILDAMMVICI